jgi:NADPH:quinone reductase-like Zn-dependent oxidoreductase
VALTRLIEDGGVTPVIDRCFPFDDIRSAFSYSEAGHARGKIVVTVSG